MVVKTLETIRFPNEGWLSTRVLGPQNSRVLIEIRGHSGNSSWCNALLTAPESATKKEKEYEWSWEKIYLLPGSYTLTEGEDKRGQRIYRLYSTSEPAENILFDLPGFVVKEASSPGVIPILECEGYSRTKKHGNRWSLIIATVDAVVAIEPYRSLGDPIYYQVTNKGIEELGTTDAVLHPAEW